MSAIEQAVDQSREPLANGSEILSDVQRKASYEVLAYHVRTRSISDLDYQRRVERARRATTIQDARNAFSGIDHPRPRFLDDPGAEEQYSVDEHGVPIMPEELVPYSRLEGSQMYIWDDDCARSLAEEVYELWKENGHRQVDLRPSPSDPLPACYGDESWIFFAMGDDRVQLENQPDPGTEDPMDDPEYREFHQFRGKALIAEAQAKKLCSECPLQKRCLANSMTYVPPRAKGRIRYDTQPIILGGYGVGARGWIYDKLRDVWGEDEYSPENPEGATYANGNPYVS